MKLLQVFVTRVGPEKPEDPGHKCQAINCGNSADHFIRSDWQPGRSGEFSSLAYFCRDHTRRVLELRDLQPDSESVQNYIDGLTRLRYGSQSEK